MSRWSAVIVCLCLCACATPTNVITEGGSQLATRSYQTRTYETLDRELTLRSVVSTLQDLGFVIDQADTALATVTATKLDAFELRMTVTVHERDVGRLNVRANARIDQHAIVDPNLYQDFFAALDKAMFLTLHAVD